MKIESSHISYPGQFRHLRVDSYRIHPSPTSAVVMTTAFIENGYWYQIEKKGYSLAKRIAQEGFDVYVLSFVMAKQGRKATVSVQDASFAEMVCQQLPKFHRRLLPQYQHIHYVGHSFGVTILMAFLLGYIKNADGEFMPDAEHAKQNTLQVRSCVSIAGLFKLKWPRRAKLPSADALRTWIYPLLDRVTAQLALTKIQPFVNALPTRQLSLVRFLPTVAPVGVFLRFLEAVGLTPSFHFANSDPEALHLALTRGSSDESLESVMTVLNLHPRYERMASRKRALSHFTEDLAHFQLPILFLQGDLDQITHPQTIRTYGFERVSSPDKQFVILKNTGHQDILTAKNPEKLFLELKTWLLRGSS